MKSELSSSQIVTKLMFRLLPIQILLALIGSVNAIVSSLFATNFIGSMSMAAVGLFGPISMLLGAISTMLSGGSQILCGKYLGKNLVEKMQNIFSLDLALSGLVGILFTVFLLLISVFDLSAFLAPDPLTRVEFNRYALGQAAGMIPMILGSQLSAYLSLENRMRRATAASIVCIAVNALLNVLFVTVLKWGTFGLSIAASLSMWVFFAVEAEYFVSGKSTLRFTFRNMVRKEVREIIKIGLPGAMGFGYQTVRGIIVNSLLSLHVGYIGISAFATANTLLAFFWAIPTGMVAVSRMLFSISWGEEDRQTLIDTMRTVLRRYLPLMCAVAALLIALAVPLTGLYYRDSADPVYEMTVRGFRILPFCMPMGLLGMAFSCFGQISGKTVFVHVLAALDGVVCVAGFTYILIRAFGMSSVLYANVLNGMVTTAVIVGYSWIKRKKFPRNAEELMVIPDDFGVAEEDRISLSLHSMEEVIRISQKIQNFCLEKGIDPRRAYLAGLCMEEMAGNVVAHGFTGDSRAHSVDVRVVCRDSRLILRIKDDCAAFDPASRREIADPQDVTKNIGIRMVYEIAENVSYQSVLGLNVLSVTV